ncbi:MAG: transcriptional repressor LexA [Spirochaetales bacterium]|nr:transcriptional repressor LexA [Spirochaetales bacterium]
MRAMTQRQKEVLSFIEHFIRDSKYPPTIREISDHFGISVRGAYDHVKALKKKGIIQTDSYRSRSIGVLGNKNEEPLEEVRKIPILGTVAAGLPILSEENYDGTVDLPNQLLGPKGEYFALRVRGDSMVGVGIMDGDVAIVKHQRTADSGQIVVAMVNEAVTLKRFFREQNRVKLQAENPQYPPLFTREIRILGTLAHLLRTYE